MVSIPSDPGARVEVWLERARTRQGSPYFHAVSYRGVKELERRSVPAADSEAAVSEGYVGKCKTGS